MPLAWISSPLQAPRARFCCAPRLARPPPNSTARYPARCTANRRWQSARRCASPSFPRPAPPLSQCDVSWRPFRKYTGRTGYKTGIRWSNQMPLGPTSTRIVSEMLEDRVSNALDWLRSAKDKFRSFAAGGDRPPFERPRVGLALAGGFARGIAHVGVLRALTKAGIPIDCVAGTSVGALIGACYCAGVPLNDMQRIASDINAGISVYYTRGPLAPPLRGSCACPGLFVPIQFEGRTLVDGFLTAPVPVEGALLLGADVVIAVYLEAGTVEQPRTFTDVLSRAFNIVQRHSDLAWRTQADVIIEPDVKPFVWDDFSKTPEMVAAGEAAALAALPQIRAVLRGEKRDSAA